jgi:hypothetical protein
MAKRLLLYHANSGAVNQSDIGPAHSQDAGMLFIAASGNAGRGAGGGGQVSLHELMAPVLRQANVVFVVSSTIFMPGLCFRPKVSCPQHVSIVDEHDALF